MTNNNENNNGNAADADADTVIGNEKASSNIPKKVKTEVAAAAADDTSKKKHKVEESATAAAAATVSSEPETPVSGNKIKSKSSKLLGKKAKTSLKRSLRGEEKNVKREEEGFAGSFADWRDRKKGKLLKKGSSSLRK